MVGLNSRELWTKNNSVRENAVTPEYGSCSLLLMGSCIILILTIILLQSIIIIIDNRAEWTRSLHVLSFIVLFILELISSFNQSTSSRAWGIQVFLSFLRWSCLFFLWSRFCLAGPPCLVFQRKNSRRGTSCWWRETNAKCYYSCRWCPSYFLGHVLLW